METNTVWQWEKNGLNETQRKVAGFQQNELSAKRSRIDQGPWTTVTTTRNAAEKMVIESTQRPGVAESFVRKWQVGRVVEEKLPGAAATIYEYDGYGRLATISGNGVRMTVLTYDAVYGHLETETTTGAGKSTVKFLTYYAPTHMSAGRVQSSAVDGLTTYSAWTARGELRAQWGITYPVRYTYDEAGRLVKMETYQSDPTGGTPAAVAASNPELWPVGDVTEWKYYAGTMALKEKKDAAGNGADYTYRADGTLWTRELARKVSGSTTPRVKATYAHNGLGELLGIGYNDGVTPDVTLTRNAQGRLATVQDGAGLHGYEWNADGTLERETRGDGSGLLYGYDAARRRTSYAWWDGAAGSYAMWGGWGFDGATGQLNRLTTPEGSLTQSYHPATGVPLAWFSGAAASPGYAETYGRDGLGRVTTVTSSAAGLAGHEGDVTRTYTYNGAGQRETLSEESGEVWEYRYDGRAQVKIGAKRTGALYLNGYRFGQPAGGVSEVVGYEYDAIGSRTQTKREGLGTLWGQTLAGPLVSTVNAYANRTVATVNYTGQRADIFGVAEAGATVTVTGTPAVNLGSVSRQGPRFWKSLMPSSHTTNPVWTTVTVTESKAGPPATQIEQRGKVFFPPVNELYSYDADGNLTQDGRWKYTWDAENRLIRMETRWQGGPGEPVVAGLPVERVEFGYDAFGRRVEKKVSVKSGAVWNVTKRVKFGYDGWNLLAEWEAAGAGEAFVLARTHHWGLDLSGTRQGAGGVGGLVLTRHHAASGAVMSAFPAYDGNGNLVALFDAVNGKRIAEYEYGPFGEPLRATGAMAAGNPFRFSTKYCDEETGLCYYGYRYYSPGMGRWVNRDPIREKGGPNLLAFNQNSPTESIDLLGLSTQAGNGWGCTLPTFQTFPWNSISEEDRAAIQADCGKCDPIKGCLDACKLPKKKKPTGGGESDGGGGGSGGGSSGKCVVDGIEYEFDPLDPRNLTTDMDPKGHRLLRLHDSCCSESDAQGTWSVH